MVKNAFDVTWGVPQHEKNIQKILDELESNTSTEIGNALKDEQFTYWSQEETKELYDLIEKNKRNMGGKPKGTIEFKDQTIDFDQIFQKFPDLEKAYDKALEKGGREKEQAFEKANNKLITALKLIYAENYGVQAKINGKGITNEDRFVTDEFLVSRDNFADEISKMRKDGRKNKDKPKQIAKGITIDFTKKENQKIIDEYKDEYTKAGDKQEKLKQIDTKIAERLILENGGWIQINNQSITDTDEHYKSEEELNTNLDNCYKGLSDLGMKVDKLQFSKPGKKYRVVRKHVELGEEILTKLSNRDMVATHLDNIMKKAGDATDLEIRKAPNEVKINLTDPKYKTIFENYEKERNETNDENERIKINTRYAEYLILKAGCYIQINNDQIDSSNPNHKDIQELRDNSEKCKNDLNNMKNKPFGNFNVKKEIRDINGKKYRYIYPGEAIKEEKPEEPNNETPEEPNNETPINEEPTPTKKPTTPKGKTPAGGSGSPVPPVPPEDRDPIIDEDEEDEEDDNEKTKEGTEKNPNLLVILKLIFRDEVTDDNINKFLELIKKIKNIDETTKNILKAILASFKGRKLNDNDYQNMNTLILIIINNRGKETDTGNAEIDKIKEENRILKERINDLTTKIENLTNTINILIQKIDKNTGKTEGEPEKPGDPKTPEGTGGNNEEELDMIEESSEISDQRTSITDLVKKEVRDAMNNEYHNLKRYNLGKKLKLFCARGRIERKRIAEEMKKHQRTAFTGNNAIDEERSAQASRHDLEERNQGSLGASEAFGDITRTTLTLTEDQQKKLDEICVNYINGHLSKDNFKVLFNEFLKKIGLPEENQYLGANILEKLDTIKSEKELGGEIAKELLSYVRASDESERSAHRERISTLINRYFEKNKKEPRFMKLIEEITHGKDAKEKIDKFLRHQQALEKLSLKNFTMKLDLLTNGKGAYEMNNKSHKNRFTKLGARFDKLPLYGRIGVMATTAGIGIGTGLLRGAWAATGVLAGIAGTRAAAKRANQYRIEQENHKDNTAKNYEEARRKEEALQAIIDDPDAGRFKKIKARREQKRYKNTTQTELESEKADTQDITRGMFYIGQNYETIKAGGYAEIYNGFILDALARYETYRKKGQNFLRSKKKEDIEKDMNNLLQSLMYTAKKITGRDDAKLKDLETLPATELVDEIGTDGTPTGRSTIQTITFTNLIDRYEKNADEALKAYKRRRALTALKSGAITAGATLATSLGIQALTGSGVFASEGQAATPGTADSNTNEWITENGEVATFQDQFKLGEYLNGGNNIHNAAANHINDLKNTDVVTIHIGSGTDATPVRIGSDLAKPETLTNHMNNVIQTIQNSNIANKDELITELNYLTPQGSGMLHTNQQLRRMRWLTVVKDTIEGAPNFTGSLHVSPDSSLDIAGTHIRDASERIAQAAFEVNHFIPGAPGTPAVEGGKERFVVGLQPFSNIFEDKPGKPADKSDPKIKRESPEPVKPTDGTTKKGGKVIKLAPDLRDTSKPKPGTTVKITPKTTGSRVTKAAA